MVVCREDDGAYVGIFSMMWWWMLGCATEVPAPNKGVHRFPSRVIHVHGKEYIVEFACTPQEVALGLRYRVLQKDEGVMLCATPDLYQ